MSRHFLLAPEVIDFQNVLRRFFDERIPFEGIGREIEESDQSRGAQSLRPLDRAFYQEIVDLGVFAAALPERSGGLGLGTSSMAAIAEELGRVLLSLPILEGLIFGVLPVLRAPESSPVGAYAEELLSGKAVISGFSGSGASGLSTGLSVSTGNSVTGTAWPIPWAEVADYLVLASGYATGDPVHVVRGGAAAWEFTPTLDRLRPISRCTFDNVPIICTETDRFLGEALALEGGILRSAELSGIAARIVEVTVSYVKTRQQFGKPIGTFQAIQHALADMHLAAEQVRTMVRFAAWCADNDRTQLTDAALAAAGLAAHLVPTIVEKSIQLHGGIGFTFEFPLHHFLRRAVCTGALFGEADDSFQELAHRFIAAPSAVAVGRGNSG